jgi:hypothetical protein
MSTSQEPLDHKPRTLVLCFDGTSNEYDADNTNVVKLFALLKKDYDDQLCYYQAGVGTYFEPGIVSPIFEWGAKVLDLAFAWYLDTHVTDGYKFLMQNYRIGDKICIFGFSRGAYTARALGGLLYKVGLLPRDNEAQVPFAYRMYKRTDAEGIKLCAGFKQTYCQTVTIEFMGVWDTVASVGVVAGRTLPFTNSNSSIKTFRHALSLDEHRVKFLPNNYHRASPSEAAAKHDPEHASSPVDPALAAQQSPTGSKGKNIVKSEKKRTSFGSTGSSSSSEADAQPAMRKGFFGRGMTMKVKEAGKYVSPTAIEGESDGECDDVLEVWFAGCHSGASHPLAPIIGRQVDFDYRRRWRCCQQRDGELPVQPQPPLDGTRDRGVLLRHHVGFGRARSRQYRPHAGAHGVRAKSRSDGRGTASQRCARDHQAVVDLGDPPALHNMAGRQWCLAHEQRFPSRQGKENRGSAAELPHERAKAHGVAAQI